MISRDEQRRLNLRATLAALTLPLLVPELATIHRAFNSWAGLGQLAVGFERLGLRLSLTHIAPPASGEQL